MASRVELAQYAADQMQDAGRITYRKMFGEYGFYCDGIFFVTLSDDQLFVKITENGRRLAPHLKTAPPYPGAKDCFLVEELGDRDFLAELVRQTCAGLSAPKSGPAGPRRRSSAPQSKRKENENHGIWL